MDGSCVDPTTDDSDRRNSRPASPGQTCVVALPLFTATANDNDHSDDNDFQKAVGASARHQRTASAAVAPPAPAIRTSPLSVASAPCKKDTRPSTPLHTAIDPDTKPKRALQHAHSTPPAATVKTLTPSSFGTGREVAPSSIALTKTAMTAAPAASLATAKIKKDKQEQGAVKEEVSEMDLESLREQSLGRLRHAWHHICEKYGRVFDSDEIDLSTDSIVVNRGFIRTMTESAFGRSLRKSLEAAVTGSSGSSRSAGVASDGVGGDSRRRDGAGSGDPALEPVKLITGLLYDDDAFERILGEDTVSESPPAMPEAETDAEADTGSLSPLTSRSLDISRSHRPNADRLASRTRVHPGPPFDPSTFRDHRDALLSEDNRIDTDRDGRDRMRSFVAGSPVSLPDLHRREHMLPPSVHTPERFSSDSHLLPISSPPPNIASDCAFLRPMVMNAGSLSVPRTRLVGPSDMVRWHDQGMRWEDSGRKSRRFHPYYYYPSSNDRQYAILSREHAAMGDAGGRWIGNGVHYDDGVYHVDDEEDDDLEDVYSDESDDEEYGYASDLVWHSPQMDVYAEDGPRVWRGALPRHVQARSFWETDSAGARGDAYIDRRLPECAVEYDDAYSDDDDGVSTGEEDGVDEDGDTRLLTRLQWHAQMQAQLRMQRPGSTS